MWSIDSMEYLVDRKEMKWEEVGGGWNVIMLKLRKTYGIRDEGWKKKKYAVKKKEEKGGREGRRGEVEGKELRLKRWEMR